MSSDVVWQVLRQHNSFVVKRDGITLSSEPGNLMNRHSYKFSGLANKKVVHVGAGKDKKVHVTISKSALSTSSRTSQPHSPLRTACEMEQRGRMSWAACGSDGSVVHSVRCLASAPPSLVAC